MSFIHHISTTRSFVADNSCLPVSKYGKSKKSKILDEDFALAVKLHLQEIGKNFRALDIVEYTRKQEVQERFGLKREAGLTTAKAWLGEMGYRYRRVLKGQYVDGHERDDIKYDRDYRFCPKVKSFTPRMRAYNNDGEEEPYLGPLPRPKPVCLWVHDESTYYQNDRRKSRWIHKDETATPYAKGEGPSIMVAEFVSADYGFLRSRDKTESARVLFKAGKAREGYFTYEEITAQVETAMDILERDYPDEEHKFMYDNATTHRKRRDNAISARKMPKFTPKEGTNWGIEVSERGEGGKIVYGPDGKPKKTKIRMGDGRLADGTPQSFYFPPDHPRAGIFKGMAVILEERGFKDAPNLRAECKGFKCDVWNPAYPACCCRRLLYEQPDFTNVKSILEEVCASRGFEVIFLPKFHCECSMIEPCWGHSKRTYRNMPPSSREADLEPNVVTSLDSIPLRTIRR